MSFNYLTSGKNIDISDRKKSSKFFLSRKDYIFYSFPLPPIDPSEFRNYLLLRLKNLYPGDITKTGWYYYIQKKSIFAVVINPQRYKALRERNLLGSLYLPPSCLKKYPEHGKFDMLIEYGDCYELISIENHRLTISHVFTGASGNHQIEERLSKAIRQFSCSEKLCLFLKSKLPGIESAISENYREIENLTREQLFEQPASRMYRLESKGVRGFPVPQSVRMVFYLLVTLLFAYLALDQYQEAKEKVLFSQNNKIRYLATLKTDSDAKINLITQKQEELDLINDREGTNIYSFLSGLATQMEGATILSVTVAGKDYELTGLHNNPLVLVDTINKTGQLGAMKLRSSVPDPESGKQYFTISGSLR